MHDVLKPDDARPGNDVSVRCIKLLMSATRVIVCWLQGESLANN